MTRLRHSPIGTSNKYRIRQEIVLCGKNWCASRKIVLSGSVLNGFYCMYILFSWSHQNISPSVAIGEKDVFDAYYDNNNMQSYLYNNTYMRIIQLQLIIPIYEAVLIFFLSLLSMTAHKLLLKTESYPGHLYVDFKYCVFPSSVSVLYLNSIPKKCIFFLDSQYSFPYRFFSNLIFPI